MGWFVVALGGGTKVALAFSVSSLASPLIHPIPPFPCDLFLPPPPSLQSLPPPHPFDLFYPSHSVHPFHYFDPSCPLDHFYSAQHGTKKSWRPWSRLLPSDCNAKVPLALTVSYLAISTPPLVLAIDANHYNISWH